MLHLEIPLWDEEDDGWMLEVEEEYFLNNNIELYDVVSTVIHEILDSVETHIIVQNILLELLPHIVIYFKADIYMKQI